MEQGLALSIVVALWNSRVATLGTYLKLDLDFAGVLPTEPLTVIIAEMQGPDVPLGGLGSTVVNKWVYSSSMPSPCEVPLNYAYNTWYDTYPDGRLFKTPSFLFSAWQDTLVVSERWGPSLVHRLSGSIDRKTETPAIRWTTRWYRKEVPFS
jgi:hypothetical protein